MVTGIEIAGITLGAFPVAVEALKIYASSAQSFTNLRRHRQVLESFGRELGVQKCIFENTCSSLLEDMVSADELKRLMDHPGGPQWKAQEFQDMLTSRLRKNTVGYFVSTVEELRATVADVVEKYEHKTPDKEPIRRRLRGMKLAALTDYRKERIEEVRKLNGDLARLISGSQPTNFEQPSKSTARSAAAYYKRIRRHAILLHDVLKDQFLARECGPVPHCAKLQLDMRRIGTPQTYMRLKFVFAFECENYPFTFLELEHLENTVQTVLEQGGAAPQVINDLCDTLVTLNTIPPNNYLGLLIDSNQRMHRVWLPHVEITPPTPQPTGETTTLGSLLSQSPPQTKERLCLGVKLASSVMQLHDTIWLNESWGKDNIIFPLATLGSADNLPQTLLRKPLVRQINESIVQASPAAESISIIQCNQCLFSLGIVLIELWYWKSIEELQTSKEKGLSGFGDSTAEYLTAKRLIDSTSDSIYDYAGTNYGDAVRRCIKGLDHRETNLEVDGFKNEVYLKILYPLEENLKSFNGWDELPRVL
ncbi:hypothetical protein K440DRAFT_663147 [Wilcoxina mikolae CBS 423.85]|nr:hypothetical protein K440DRAFT_663147 [Wilcoxina mikolae CBS 423.85]